MNKREAKEYVREYGNLVGRRYARPYVWASLCIIFKGEPLSCTGVARCSEDDEWDINRGIEIAQGRAVAGLADKIVARTWREDVVIQGKGGLVLTVAGHNAITAHAYLS